MKNIKTLIVFSVFFLAFCTTIKGQQKTATNEKVDANKFALIGRIGITTFPAMTVETNYLSDSSMHWKTTSNKGVVAQGDEKISYEKLENHLHFLNWVEKNGYVISLIINTKKGKVKAFWSYADEKARGKRGATFTDGKFEFLK